MYSTIFNYSLNRIKRNELINHLHFLSSKFHQSYYVNKAVASCVNFTIPQSHIDVSKQQYFQSNSLIQYISSKQSIQRHNRFNTNRVKRYCYDNPEYKKLLHLANYGVEIDIPSNFTHQYTMPTLRPLHMKLINVMRWHAFKLCQKDKALILPISAL